MHCNPFLYGFLANRNCVGLGDPVSVSSFQYGLTPSWLRGWCGGSGIVPEQIQDLIKNLMQLLLVHFYLVLRFEVLHLFINVVVKELLEALENVSGRWQCVGVAVYGVGPCLAERPTSRSYLPSCWR